MYSVAIDSDGVIADFNSKVVEILEGKQMHEVPKGLLWKEIGRYDRKVEPFFESLGFMDNAHDLVEFAINNFDDVFVLTASGYVPRNAPQQKINWYAKHFPQLRVVVVDKSGDKAAYATPTTILVDDRAKSIDPWVGAGGIGILHTSVESTIEQLRQYI